MQSQQKAHAHNKNLVLTRVKRQIHEWKQRWTADRNTDQQWEAETDGGTEQHTEAHINDHRKYLVNDYRRLFGSQ